VVKNQACIAIGINQYQFFQPLSYAQQDAQALGNFLVDEARLPAERCVLLTDTSPPASDHSTYPSKENILAWLDRQCREQVQPGDLLWCFFSGYGMSWEGQDFLMPAEGDPTDIPATGIPMRELFATLKAAPADMVVVLLDMNRASSMRSHDAIGTETVELAKRLEIPTLLSCRPGQFSREVSALHHGLFTAALLEGLRYNRCIDLDSLERYLNHRLPELSEHHWLPVQEPLMVVNPREKIHQVIWPQNDAVTASKAVASQFSSSSEPHLGNGFVTPSVEYSPLNGNGFNGSRREPGNLALPSDAPLKSAGAGSQMGKPAAEPADAAPVLSGNASETPKSQESVSSQKWVLWGGAAALVLLLGVAVSRVTTVNQSAPETSSMVAGTDEISQPAAVPKEATTAAQTPQAAAPTPQPVRSQTLLDKAILTIQPVQATHFSSAITTAGQIPPNDPLYAEAQQNIERWGGVILDIAIGRAKQGNFQGAISAAKLVPKERPELNAQAQKLIAQWQQLFKVQQANQKLLNKAVGSIRRGQLDSYTLAIATAGQIPAGQPKYAEAQKLIAQWSAAMFNEIALYRAARGQFSAAIEAANLVPASTPTYAKAQKAIAQWKPKVKR
jgi:uncharacterized caspase-like protein